ncbi:MAG: hypothetical protein FWF51_10865 [Chitinivibrionia bacterium]|nr:hypothetical protein [Chitinivibrionia bacterium]
MGRIALISCAKQKCNLPRTKAKNMYASPLFKKSLEYVKNKLKPNKTFILSAKYGLLELEQEIDIYDETLKDKSKKEKREWAEKVFDQIKLKCNIEIDEFIFLAGKIYYKNLINLLPNREKVKILMENYKIGKRLHFLKGELNE